MNNQINFFNGMSPFGKLLFFTIISIVCFLICFAIGFAISIPVFNLDIHQFSQNNVSEIESNINFLKFMQVIQSIGLFILPSLIIAFLYSGGKPALYLNLINKTKLNSFLLVISIAVIALPFINFLAQFNMQLKLPAFLQETEIWMKNQEESARIMTEKFLKVETLPALWFNLFMMAVLPAIGEEFFFRGVLQKIFTEWTKNIHIGIIITSVVFSAIHFQFYGFIPRMVLGMLFGYFLFWSGNMWLPILAHFINNALAVISYFYMAKGKISTDIDQLGANDETVLLAFICFLFLTGLLFLLYQTENKVLNNNSIE